MSESGSSDVCREWTEDFLQLWSIQDSLLQSYRNYLIIIESLMAGAAATIVAILHGDSDKFSKVIRKLACNQTIDIPWHQAAMNLIEFLVLLIFIIFGMYFLYSMKEIIINRGANVTLCQQMVANLQTGRFISLFEDHIKTKIDRNTLRQLSPMAAFKHAEGRTPSSLNFEFNDPANVALQAYFMQIKANLGAGLRDGGTRGVLNFYIFLIFYIVWSLISAFLVVLLINLI